jgi:putative SOS response-associated peptidase YedK
MCGRFASTSSISQIADALGVEEIWAEALPERYNVAPTNQIYAVAVSHSPAPDAPTSAASPDGSEDEAASGHRVLGTFRWGLVPSWAKDLSVGYKMINARAEGIAERPAYRRALVKRRCIIPVDYYYEWQVRTLSAAALESAAAEAAVLDLGAESEGGDGSAGRGSGGRGSGARGARAKKPKAPPKLPWAIHRADGAPMYMAGLWEVWRDPALGEGAEPLRSCTIVTTAANEALSAIHDRMPVILDAAGTDAWLDPALQDPAEIASLLLPAPPEWFAAYPVSTLVNKVGVDGPELLIPLPDPPPGVDLGLHLPR